MNALLPIGSPTLDQILQLQAVMLHDAEMRGEPDGTDHVCPVTHHFAPGLYAREMLIPAGCTLVGKMHRHAHLCAITKGRIAVVSDGVAKEIAAPAVFLSTPGVKRAGHAIEETVWITFHPTEKTDLAEIEADVIVPESEALSMARTGVLS